jgi:hypothetical protein
MFEMRYQASKTVGIIGRTKQVLVGNLMLVSSTDSRRVIQHERESKRYD